MKPKETVGREAEAWRQLSISEEVRQQQAAFTVATGLPLTLVPASAEIGPPEQARATGAFCVEGCMGGRSGNSCQRMLYGAEQRSVLHSQPVSFRCPSGLTKIIVPVFIGDRHVGNLLAGPFALQALDAGTLQRLTARLHEWGLVERAEGLKEAWAYSPRITDEKGKAAATLMMMFVRHLSALGNEILQRKPNSPPPLLRKIDNFLAVNHGRPVSLSEVAERVHLSPCYFCKLFKKQVGMTFTEYRARARIEKAKQLLKDNHRRVSEVAFEAGFDSIPHFNRVFRQQVGCSPSEYRAGRRTKDAKKLTIHA
jgi:AraC-like DNA-binding protein